MTCHRNQTPKFGGTIYHNIINFVSRIWTEYRRLNVSKAGGWNLLKPHLLPCVVEMLTVGSRPQVFSMYNLPSQDGGWVPRVSVLHERDCSPATSPLLTQPQKSYSITFTLSSSLRQSQNHPDSRY